MTIEGGVMADESISDGRLKRVLDLLAVQIQAHGQYHDEKGKMTWLIMVTYLGATALLIGRYGWSEKASP